MRDKQPVCECDDWHCDEPLGIGWREHARETKLGILIASTCKTPRVGMRVVALAETYTIYTKLAED